MKSKKIIFIVIAIIAVIVVLYLLLFCNIYLICRDNYSSASLLTYPREEKKDKIISPVDIVMLNKYFKQIEDSPNQNLKLAISNDIEIQYGNNVKVTISLNEEECCYYENKKKNISGFRRLPSGLYNWVQSKYKKRF